MTSSIAFSRRVILREIILAKRVATWVRASASASRSLQKYLRIGFARGNFPMFTFFLSEVRANSAAALKSLSTGVRDANYKLECCEEEN